MSILTLENRLTHLSRMTDERGLFEHALNDNPRLEHGYCTDDNARLLLYLSRMDSLDETTKHLTRVALDFIEAAQAPDGQIKNRLDRFGRWTDAPGVHDAWGRTVMALGSTAVNHADPAVRLEALAAFNRSVYLRTHHPRAMAFASLGAAEILAGYPSHQLARNLLIDMLAMFGPLIASNWMWPEPRLAYGNATIAEAVLAAGFALGRAKETEKGLAMLDWLLRIETRDGHLSVTGHEGREYGDYGKQFDQQPIEVAAMADACWRACRITGDIKWHKGVVLALDWFNGGNDSSLVMYDEETGGGYDGLHADRVNLNMGAESTLAYLFTIQRAAD